MAVTFNQASIIKQFNDTYKHKFNDRIFEKKNSDLIKAMTDNILSIQRNQNFVIKVLDIFTVTDYYQIQKILKLFVQNGEFRKEDIPQFDKLNLEESSYYLMVVRYLIKTNRGGGVQSKILEVPILIPEIVDKYYFKIDNLYYHPVYQVNSNSVYNNLLNKRRTDPCVTFISLFTPLKVYKRSVTLNTVDSQELNCTNYELHAFSKHINIFIYTMAKLGLFDAMWFHNIYDIYITEEPIDNPEYYTFNAYNKKCKSNNGNVYINVNKNMFDNDRVYQSDVYGIIKGIMSYKKPFLFHNIFTTEFWIMVVGTEFSPKNPTITKSTNILKSLEGTFDKRSFDKLRLPVDKKQTIYHVLLWIIREYDVLSTEDRVSLDKKNIQWVEYIANTYSNKITNSIYMLSDRGKSVKIEDVARALKVKPNILLNNIKSKMNLASYRDLVNDLDGITALKYTLKNTSSSKSKKKKKSSKLPTIFSDVDISHLGRLDVDSSTKSDPGMSGILCPLTEVYGEYNCFADFTEPNDYDIRFKDIYTNKNDLFISDRNDYMNKDLANIYKQPKVSNISIENIDLFTDYIPEDNEEEDDE